MEITYLDSLQGLTALILIVDFGGRQDVAAPAVHQ